MFYRLKTDLPTFKAGDLFYLDRNGSLRHKDTDIVAYHYSTLMKFPDALEKFWEPVEEEFSRRADENCNFFTLNHTGKICCYIECGDTISNDTYAMGNYFKTEKEAEAAVKYLKALATVRDDAKGFTPDWNKPDEQSRWVVCFVHKSLPPKLEVVYDNNLDYQFNSIFGLPYFRTENDAEASIKKHRKEWETIFGVKDETECDDE